MDTCGIYLGFNSACSLDLCMYFKFQLGKRTSRADSQRFDDGNTNIKRVGKSRQTKHLWEPASVHSRPRDWLKPCPCDHGLLPCEEEVSDVICRSWLDISTVIISCTYCSNDQPIISSDCIVIMSPSPDCQSYWVRAGGLEKSRERCE